MMHALYGIGRTNAATGKSMGLQGRKIGILPRAVGPMLGSRTRPALVALLGSLAALALCSASAPAAPPFLTEFCETGTGAGQRTVPRGIAVDPTSGDIYLDRKRT